MTEAQRAALARLAEEFAATSRQLARVSAILAELDLSVASASPPAAAPMPYWPPPAPVAVPYPTPPPPPPAYASPPAYRPSAPQQHTPVRSAEDRERGWIGKALAAAGVAVTLIGVVLLLVLAAQAGILRPELRVGAGVALAAALVGLGVRTHARPGGRVGAIALAATGVAAAYMDAIAVTTIYHWVASPVGLVVAALVGGGGLTLARRWDSQHLALLVLVPLTMLAPVITDGVTLLLVGFMLALSAVALPVQLGKDWIWMHAARTAATTLPLLVALAAAHFGSHDDPWLLGGACGVAAALAIIGALLLLRSTVNPVAVALLTVAGVLPVLAAAVAVDRWMAAMLAAALSLCLLAIVLLVDRLPGVAGAVAQIWSVLSAVSGLLAVTVTFRGPVAAPVLLALATVVAVAGRRESAARWVAVGFGVIGAGMFLDYAPPAMLVTATPMATPDVASTLAASVLVAVWGAVAAWSWVGTEVDEPGARALWAGAGAVIVYAVTAFTVALGVLIGGSDGGFLAGHMAATICWIVLAAALFWYAIRVRRRDSRAAPIAGGLALTAAAMAKLFLFDLGTLDGIFRVVVFIVVGLVLLAMGAGYARSLAAKGDPSDSETRYETPAPDP